MDYKFQAPFSYPEAMKESFAPNQVLTEDTHSDGTPKSKGNAFDLTRRKEDRPVVNKNHDVKKVSTGTVYTRKSETFDKDNAPAGEGTVAAPKRGRGRPPGKYGSYKKKIKEALESHSVLESEQLDELSKKTLGSYINKAVDNSSTHRIYGLMRKSEAGSFLDKAVNSSSAKNKQEFYQAKDNATKDYIDSARKANKRDDGIKKAANRLTKEDLDEMTQDEFDDLVENFEQLDELSKNTLGSYVKKAAFDARNSGAIAGYSAARSSEAARDGYEFTSDSEAKRSLKNSKKADDRLRGIVKATKRLTKEDFESNINEGLNDDDYYIVHRDKKHIVKNIGKIRVPFGMNPLSNPQIKDYIDSADKKHGSGHTAAKGNELKYLKGYKNLNEDLAVGTKVQVEGKIGTVEHSIGSTVMVRLEEGLKSFHSDNVKLVQQGVKDNTLIEGVSWDRWDTQHQPIEKENIGTWVISLNEDGYRYGQVEGKDYFNVKGNGMDAALAAQDLAKESGKTAYILEAFTPEEDKDALTFSKIVRSAFSV